MASIDERIAELEQRIAEKKAYQRMYRPNRNMAAWDYVAEGDRSGYDKIDASEAAYHNMLRQQEQQNALLKAQQEFTAKENALNRQNAKEIAEQNRIVGANDKIDELTRLRGKSLVNLQYAEAAYKQAKDRGDVSAMESANRDIQLAKEDLAYYNKRLGNNVVKETKDTHKATLEEETPIEEQTIEGGEEPPVNISVDIERYKAITRGKKALLDATLKEIKDNPNFNQSPELQREYQRISKIKSEEQLNSEKAARKAKWEAGKKLTGFDYRRWKESLEGKALIKEFGE